MLPIGNTPNPMKTLLRAATGLPRTVAHISRLASVVQRGATAVHLFDISASLAHSDIDWAHVQYGIRAVNILSAVPTTGALPRISRQENSTNSSGVTNEGGTGVPGGRTGTGTLPHQAPPDAGRVLGLFHKLVSLLRGTVTASKQSTKRKHPEPAAQTPSLSDAYAQALASLWRLGQAMLAFAVPVFTRALRGTAHAIDCLTAVARRHSFISAGIGAIVATLVATALVGAAHFAFQNTFIPAFIRGWQDVVWLLRNLGTVAEFVTMLADLSLGWYVVIAAGFCVAGYELYRHWGAAKRLLSRWIESAHKAIARLMTWMADKIRTAAAYAGNSIASLAATPRDALHLLTTAATTVRGVNRAQAIEHAGAGARPEPMLRAVRRATAAAAFAAPLMLAGAPAGALAAPSTLVSQTASLAAGPSEMRPARAPIVINYAPNVIIHPEEAVDSVALKRRVMEVLERHGRELHQVLAREIVRQQRQDF